MKRPINEMDELFKRDLPSAPDDAVEARGERVLDRLRAHQGFATNLKIRPELNVKLKLDRAPLFGRKTAMWTLAAAVLLAVSLQNLCIVDA